MKLDEKAPSELHAKIASYLPKHKAAIELVKHLIGKGEKFHDATSRASKTTGSNHHMIQAIARQHGLHEELNYDKSSTDASDDDTKGDDKKKKKDKEEKPSKDKEGDDKGSKDDKSSKDDVKKDKDGKPVKETKSQKKDDEVKLNDEGVLNKSEKSDIVINPKAQVSTFTFDQQKIPPV